MSSLAHWQLISLSNAAVPCGGRASAMDYRFSSLAGGWNPRSQISDFRLRRALKIKKRFFSDWFFFVFDGPSDDAENHKFILTIPTGEKNHFGDHVPSSINKMLPCTISRQTRNNSFSSHGKDICAIMMMARSSFVMVLFGFALMQ